MPQLNSFVVTSVKVAGSKPGKEYTVSLMGGETPITCSCPQFEHRAGPNGERCKHMAARVGPDAVGSTRCASCRAFLTPADIEAQFLPEDPSATVRRLCEPCRAGTPLEG